MNLSLLQSHLLPHKRLQRKLLPISSLESQRVERKETWREEEGDLPRVDKEHNKSEVFVAKRLAIDRGKTTANKIILQATAFCF